MRVFRLHCFGHGRGCCSPAVSLRANAHPAPYSGIRVGSLQSEARSALPVGSSREQVLAWRDARRLAYRTVRDKSGESFLWYLVRMPNGNWLKSNGELWMTINFYPSERLLEMSAGED